MLALLLLAVLAQDAPADGMTPAERAEVIALAEEIGFDRTRFEHRGAEQVGVQALVHVLTQRPPSKPPIPEFRLSARHKRILYGTALSGGLLLLGAAWLGERRRSRLPLGADADESGR